MNTYPAIASEAVLLGLVSGPACIASCGPLLVPFGIEQAQRLSRTSAQLGMFIAARFCGYLVFATAAWSMGRAIPSQSTQALAFGIAHLGVAVALAIYAIGRWRRGSCAAAAIHAEPKLVTIGAPPSRFWAPLFGFLTGLSLCPPFLAAGVRVMELSHLGPAILFFVMFFAGTLVWFAPFFALGVVRWKEPAMFVARITMLLLSGYYGYLGVVILVGRLLHG